MRLTGNDHARGIVNFGRATVVAIESDRQTVTLAKGDGERIGPDTSKPLHLDHGDALTVHAARGQTVDRVLIEADTRSPTANESSYYVAISRWREEVHIFTDDRHMLPAAIGAGGDQERGVGGESRPGGVGSQSKAQSTGSLVMLLATGKGGWAVGQREAGGGAGV